MRSGLGTSFRRLAPTALALTLLAASGAAGCAGADVRYPGRADVRAGDPPVIWIEPTGSTETSPRVLRVPIGTEVTWRNSTGETVFIRFKQPVERICGEPYRFAPNYDNTSYVTPFLPPSTEASLCFAEPGRYDFIVSSPGIGGGRQRTGDEEGGGLSPVRYGTVIVE